MLLAWCTLAFLLAQTVAQTTTDPISGGAAWVGNGILGGVLGWYLFVRTPATDKQLVSLIESRDAAIRQLVERHDVAIKDLTDRFTATVAEITIKHAEAEREQRHYFRDQLQSIVLRYEQEREFTATAIRANLDEQRAFLGDARRILDELRRLLGQPTLLAPAPGRPGRSHVGDPDAGKKG